MSGHECPAPGCDRRVPTAQYACRQHWFSIPKPLRDELWDAYRKEWLGDHHVAAMEACDAFLRAAASGGKRAHRQPDEETL